MVSQNHCFLHLFLTRCDPLESRRDDMFIEKHYTTPLSPVGTICCFTHQIPVKTTVIKIFSISIVGVLMLSMLGCGCLFPSTPHIVTDLYADVSEAEDLQYYGKYGTAIEKYEQALKKLPQFPVDTKVINISFPTFFKYHIAFCYAKLVEAEGDVSLYIKAEAAARESYESAVVPSDQVDALYLWGYILFKQARYEEARAKFEDLIEIFPQHVEKDDRLRGSVLYGLGKAHLELGDKAAARRTFTQLEVLIQTLVKEHGIRSRSRDYIVEALYALGKVHLELDEAAARRTFAQLEVLIEIALRDRSFTDYGFLEKTLYALGKTYTELGDGSTARRVFTQLCVNFPDSSYKTEVERLLEKQ